MTLCALLTILSSVSAAEPIKMRTLAQGNFSGLQTAINLVVTNSAQWREIWNKHSVQRTPAQAAPEVDFQKESVLIVTAGQKRSGGHRIEIAEVRQTGEKVQVLVKTRAAKPGGIQIQALTAPFHIAAIPKVDLPVQFQVQEDTSGRR